MNFGKAIEFLKGGEAVTRRGWNGRNMFIWLKPAGTIKAEWCKDEILKKTIEANGGEMEALGTICMKTADNKILTGWLASQTDMLSDDWELYDIDLGCLVMESMLGAASVNEELIREAAQYEHVDHEDSYMTSYADAEWEAISEEDKPTAEELEALSDRFDPELNKFSEEVERAYGTENPAEELRKIRKERGIE